MASGSKVPAHPLHLTCPLEPTIRDCAAHGALTTLSTWRSTLITKIQPILLLVWHLSTHPPATGLHQGTESQRGAAQTGFRPAALEWVAVLQCQCPASSSSHKSTSLFISMDLSWYSFCMNNLFFSSRYTAFSFITIN